MTRPTATPFEEEDAGRTWRLRYLHPPDIATDRIFAPLIDAHLGLARTLFSPLTVRVDVGYVDAEEGYDVGAPDRVGWCLEVDSPAALEGESWQPPETRVAVPVIDRAAMEEFLRTATDQPAEPGDLVCPVAMWVRAVRARLPEPWSDQGDELLVRHQGGTARVAIERDEEGAWVRGPVEGLLRAPIRTAGLVAGIELRLGVDAYWSPWFEEGAAGTAMIERAVAALVAQGWELTG